MQQAYCSRSVSKQFLVKKKQTKILLQWQLAELHVIKGRNNLYSQKQASKQTPAEGGETLHVQPSLPTRRYCLTEELLK